MYGGTSGFSLKSYPLLFLGGMSEHDSSRLIFMVVSGRVILLWTLPVVEYFNSSNELFLDQKGNQILDKSPHMACSWL